MHLYLIVLYFNLSYCVFLSFIVVTLSLEKIFN